MKNHQKTGIWIFFLIITSVLFVGSFMFKGEPGVNELTYTEFVQKIDAGAIEKVQFIGNVAEALPKGAVEDGDNRPSTGVGQTTPAQQKKFRVRLPDQNPYENLQAKLDDKNIDYVFEPPRQSVQWTNFLMLFGVPLIFLALFFFLFKNAQAGGSQAMSFGKSKAKMMLDSKVKITFKDVAGIDEAKQDLEEIVDFLKNGERYQKLGAKIPKGVLLVGAPGTGKTLLAKAVAGEAGVPFFTISGSDFVEMFVGVGASRVRDLFDQAKKHAPCIVFVDEIDAVGRQRGAGMGGGHDEREQTLNQLLVEMDGFDPTTGIIILAATNRPDILDNALLRPGRFDRQVVIDRPDVKGREDILKVHAKGKPLADDVDLKILAKRTPGFTGADLSNLLNEGALRAARVDKESVNMEDIESSIDKVVAGNEKRSKLISEKDKELTAYHEVGHALVAVLDNNCDPLRKVTIIPRGMALGITWTTPDDATHITKTKLLADIGMALGGRIAEEVVFGDITTGASSDLEKVSQTARKIVTAYGMSDDLGPITYGSRNDHVFMGRDFGTERNYSEDIAGRIDKEVSDIVSERYQYVTKLLTDNRDMMDAIVKELLEKETLDDAEVAKIIRQVRLDRGETVEDLPEEEDTTPPPTATASDDSKASEEKETEASAESDGPAAMGPTGIPAPQGS